MTRLPKPIAKIQEFYPSEYLDDSNKISFKEDLDRAVAVFETDKTKKLTFFPLGHDGHMFHMLLDGTVQSNGIIQNDRFQTHSFCFELSDPNETKALDSLGDPVFLRYPWIIEEFEYKSPIKKDKLWIKCKHQNGQYIFKHPFTSHQKKTAGFPLTPDQSLILTTKLGAYVDWENQTYGLSLNLLKIEVPGDLQPLR
jgi:hypothetical protein